MSRRQRARVARIEVDLLMECADDELSPWQQEANKKAEAEYKDALNRIQAAKAMAMSVQAQTVQPAAVPVVTNVERPAPSDSPDVIIVDETPAPRLGNRKKPNTPVSSKPVTQAPIQGMAFTQTVGSNGQTILLPNAPFNQQYQIINGQAHVLTRPLMPGQVGQGLPGQAGIPIQRVTGQPRRQQFMGILTPVSGTHGLGVKRTSTGAAVEPANKKSRPQRRHSSEKDEAGNWVPLDEYYYSKKEGDPAYREEKGEFRFKCWYCHKMLYNNLRIMMHMQGHIDSEKQQNLDLSDLTQCKHCYKQFDTPFEMQCHIEKIHQKQSNVLVCRICEKDHDTQSGLRTHMRACHNACEMPYICQLCNFRSSIFSDVVDHFKKRHDSSQYVMCLYCLRVFKVNFSKQSGWGLTQNYYQHLQKHQLKNSCRKCPCCKLTFVNKSDAKLHRNKDHLPNYKGILGAGTGSMTTTTADKEQVMIKIPDKKSSQLKSLNAPVSSKVRTLGSVSFRNLLRDLDCYECGYTMASQDHYKQYVECSMCRFATTCSYSYMNHMTGFHAGNQEARMASIPRERPMKQVMYCLCGYSSKYGNMIANHLIFCSKRTSYTNKPEMRWFEYDDEQEEFNPFEPYIEEPDTPETESPKKDHEITLFDALGLVKRAPKPGQTKHGSSRKDKDPIQVMDMPSTPDDEIPPELTGERKWSTVKLSDSKEPSRKSIFLGDDKDVSKDSTDIDEEKDGSEGQKQPEESSESSKSPGNVQEESLEKDVDKEETREQPMDVAEGIGFTDATQEETIKTIKTMSTEEPTSSSLQSASSTKQEGSEDKEEESNENEVTEGTQDESSTDTEMKENTENLVNKSDKNGGDASSSERNVLESEESDCKDMPVDNLDENMDSEEQSQFVDGNKKGIPLEKESNIFQSETSTVEMVEKQEGDEFDVNKTKTKITEKLDSDTCVEKEDIVEIAVTDLYSEPPIHDADMKEESDIVEKCELETDAENSSAKNNEKKYENDAVNATGNENSSHSEVNAKDVASQEMDKYTEEKDGAGQEQKNEGKECRASASGNKKTEIEKDPTILVSLSSNDIVEDPSHLAKPKEDVEGEEKEKEEVAECEEKELEKCVEAILHEKQDTEQDNEIMDTIEQSEKEENAIEGNVEEKSIKEKKESGEEKSHEEGTIEEKSCEQEKEEEVSQDGKGIVEEKTQEKETVEENTQEKETKKTLEAKMEESPEDKSEMKSKNSAEEKFYETSDEQPEETTLDNSNETPEKQKTGGEESKQYATEEDMPQTSPEKQEESEDTTKKTAEKEEGSRQRIHWDRSRDQNHKSDGNSEDRRDERRRDDYRRDDHHRKSESYRDREYHRRDDRYRDNRHGGGYGGRYNDHYNRGGGYERRGGYRGGGGGGGGYHRNDWHENRRGGRGGYRGGYGGYY